MYAEIALALNLPNWIVAHLLKNNLVYLHVSRNCRVESL